MKNPLAWLGRRLPLRRPAHGTQPADEQQPAEQLQEGALQGGAEEHTPVLTASELVHNSEFVMGSVAIGKKELQNFIKGKGFELGADYYYGYLYRDGILYYIILNSGDYVAGKIAVLSLAFLREGRFFYQQRDRGLAYLITHQDGEVRTEVAHMVPPEFEDLAKVAASVDQPLAPSLYLVWSLAPQVALGNWIYTAIFAASLVIYYLSSARYADLSKVVAKASVPEPVATHDALRSRPHLARLLARVGSEVDGKGVILKLAFAKGKGEFRIRFPEENAARSFATLHGGHYEEGNVVVFSPGAADSR